MKKRTLIISLICMLLVGGVIIGFAILSGKKPYKNLDATQIASATVHLAPPDITVQIEDIEELVTYLKDVVIYNEDNSYREYDGQGVTFTLTMTDGTQTSIMAYNPFLVIDGVGYKTKYKPCEALSNYANKLLKISVQNPSSREFYCQESNNRGNRIRTPFSGFSKRFSAAFTLWKSTS